jgi:hypothetical protein
VLNLPCAALELAAEARCLGRMGVALPPPAATAALIEPTLRRQADELGALLARHERAVGALGDAQRALLAGRLAEVLQAFDPGLSRITWASLAAPQFIEAVQKASAGGRPSLRERVRRLPGALGSAVDRNAALYPLYLSLLQALDGLETLAAQLQWHAQALERSVRCIAATQLFAADVAPTEDGGGLPGLYGFCLQCEERMQRVRREGGAVRLLPPVRGAHAAGAEGRRARRLPNHVPGRPCSCKIWDAGASGRVASAFAAPGFFVARSAKAGWLLCRRWRWQCGSKALLQRCSSVWRRRCVGRLQAVQRPWQVGPKPTVCGSASGSAAPMADGSQAHGVL